MRGKYFYSFHVLTNLFSSYILGIESLLETYFPKNFENNSILFKIPLMLFRFSIPFLFFNHYYEILFFENGWILFFFSSVLRFHDNCCSAYLILLIVLGTQEYFNLNTYTSVLGNNLKLFLWWLSPLFSLFSLSKLAL